MCLHFLVPLDKICTTDKLSQWNRILRKVRDAVQVLIATVIAKRSLKVIERERGTSCPRRTREPVACVRGTETRLACVSVKMQE